MQVRPAIEADRAACIAMGAKFYATTHYAAIAPYAEANMHGLFDFMRDTGILLVAEVDGQVIGMVGLMVVPFLFNGDTKAAHEVMWWVEPEARQSAAGLGLLRAIEPAAREAGAVMVQMMNLADTHDRSARIYERNGYRHTESSFTKVL